VNDFDEEQSFILENVIPPLNEAHIEHFTSKTGKAPRSESESIRTEDEEDRGKRPEKFIGARKKARDEH
jgi:hypothetical protein